MSLSSLVSFWLNQETHPVKTSIISKTHVIKLRNRAATIP